MSLLRTTTLFFVFLALALGVCAQENHGVLYQLPKDWVEADQDLAKVFVPKGVQEEDLLVVILSPAKEINDDPPLKQFETLVAAANADSTVVGKGEVTTLPRKSGTLIVQTYDLDDTSLGRHKRMYAVLVEGKRLALAMVLVRPDTLLSKYDDDIVALISSLSFKPDASTVSKIPTGDTPDLFIGSQGWLPSGKGVALPATADFVQGRPHGLWWKAQADSRGVLKPIVHVYLEDGTRASMPRLGGGNLFDKEGQLKQKGANGVGTYTLAGGKFTESSDGFSNTGDYVAGADSDGKFFRVGGALFRPVVPLTTTNIVGKWTALGSSYTFRADGTYESGTILNTGDYVAGSFMKGTYVIEGFLLMLKPEGAPIQIDRAGLGGQMLIKGSTFFSRSSGAPTAPAAPTSHRPSPSRRRSSR